MQAMVLEKHGVIEASPLQRIEVPEPWPVEGEVRIKVGACGVCRTDLHVIEGELPRKKMPLIPGHQVVGTIDVVGKGSRRFRVGQRVGIAWLRQTCGTCSYCVANQENLCDSSSFTGYHANGGFAEYAVVPEAFAYLIPDEFEMNAAAPLLCAGIIGYRSLSRAQVPTGGTLGLFGFGSSAHIVLQLARRRGHRVFVISRADSHLQLARDLGADWAGKSPFDFPRKLDSAIIFSPAGEMVPAALQSLRKGGTLAFAGIHMTAIPALDYEKHLFYERGIHSVTCNTRKDGEEFLIEAARIGLKPRITTYPLALANKALQDLKADRVNGSAVLVM